LLFAEDLSCASIKSSWTTEDNEWIA
jgi:hypothetical protein